MRNFPKGSRKPKIVGKTTSLRKLGGEIDKGVDLGGPRPSRPPSATWLLLVCESQTASRHLFSIACYFAMVTYGMGVKHI